MPSGAGREREQEKERTRERERFVQIRRGNALLRKRREEEEATHEGNDNNVVRGENEREKKAPKCQRFHKEKNQFCLFFCYIFMCLILKRNWIPIK